jgi:tetratricopeptide (TPR) repeat protein
VDIIKETLKNLPGEIHYRPWVNFSHNRNEALLLAKELKQEYTLIIDADDTLEYECGFTLPLLTAVGYYLEVHHNNLRYWQVHIVHNTVDFQYEGVTHEVLTSSRLSEVQKLNELVYRIGTDGANRLNKFKRDIELLKTELTIHPDNARAMFYLAQSYRDDGNTSAAIESYTKRVAMGGWQEEVWISLLELAKLQPSVESYLRVYELQPTRAEPLCYLAIYLRWMNHIKQAFPFALAASQIPVPSNEILFIDHEVYTWKSLDELAISSYYVGQYMLAFDTCRKLLDSNSLPPSERPRIESAQEHARWQLPNPLMYPSIRSCDIPSELHITITSTAYKTPKSAIHKCISSVRAQKNKRYHHVYMAADEETVTIASSMTHKRLTVVNSSQTGYIGNIGLESLLSYWKELPKDEIVVWLDGDDSLIGTDALDEVLYTYSKGAWVTYGQTVVMSKRWLLAAQVGPNPRSESWGRATHLKTFRAGLIKYIRDEDLRTPDGSYGGLAMDQGIMLPLLEMAQERAIFIPRVIHEYNWDNSFEAHATNDEKELLRKTVERIRSFPKYERLEKY